MLRATTAWRGSGAIRASGMRLAGFSLRCTAGLPEGFDTRDLKEAKALLGELAS
jgi:hypothetical protein